MACKDCPDFIPPQNNSRRVAVIVYTGGPPYALFANVIRTLSADLDGVITKWSRPTVHPDGGIEYKQNEAKPPEIEGYQRDAVNFWLLRPIWPHCVWRMLRVWREDTGAVIISAGCNLPNSGAPPDESLRLTHCQNCPHRTQ